MLRWEINTSSSRLSPQSSKRRSHPRSRHSPAESISGRRVFAAPGLGAMAPSPAKPKASLLGDGGDGASPPRACFPAAASHALRCRRGGGQCRASPKRGSRGLEAMSTRASPPAQMPSTPTTPQQATPTRFSVWNLSKSARARAMPREGNVPGLTKDQIAAPAAELGPGGRFCSPSRSAS